MLENPSTCACDQFCKRGSHQTPGFQARGDHCGLAPASLYGGSPLGLNVRAPTAKANFHSQRSARDQNARGVYFEFQGLLLVFLGQLLTSQRVLLVLLLEFRVPHLKLFHFLRGSLVQYLKGTGE